MFVISLQVALGLMTGQRKQCCVWRHDRAHCAQECKRPINRIPILQGAIDCALVTDYSSIVCCLFLLILLAIAEGAELPVR